MEQHTKHQRRLFYCKSWFRAKKRPTELWSRDFAEAAHRAGTHYDVLVGSAERPSCFLTVTKGFVGVGFLDERLRVYLEYAFREVDTGRLFLADATHREFEGDLDTVARGATYRFDPSGAVRIIRREIRLATEEASETFANVSAHFERWPEFGDYERLTVVERSI